MPKFALEPELRRLTPPSATTPILHNASHLVIGGPNGAGKTTIAGGLLPGILECDEYVNADAIAKALSPFESDRAAFRAGRVMLETIRDLADRQRDFAFETTMASRSFVPFLASCRDRGYEINLLFLWLRSIALAQRRVANRVRGGGHGIPSEVVRRRYKSGISNFLSLYVPLADSWYVYDNSGTTTEPVARRIRGGKIQLHQPTVWRRIVALAR